MPGVCGDCSCRGWLPMAPEADPVLPGAGLTGDAVGLHQRCIRPGSDGSAALTSSQAAAGVDAWSCSWPAQPAAACVLPL